MSDWLSPREAELLNLETATGTESYLSGMDHISFASPDSDFVSNGLPTHEVADDVRNIASYLSFASPESDFCAPSIEEIRESEEMAAWVATNYSFSAPENDFTRPTMKEMEASGKAFEEVARTVSFSAPESDFCSAFENLIPVSHPNIEPERIIVIPSSADKVRQIEDVPIVITSPSPKFTITHVNQAWVGLCGFSTEEAIGKTLSLLHGTETDRSIVTEIQQAIVNSEPIEKEVVNYSSNGRKFRNHLKIKPLDDGTLVGVLQDMDEASYSRVRVAMG
jgi:PAS domain S-box-containing protein